MTDFSKTLIRCHALGNIMTNPKGKTDLDRYNSIVSELKIEREKYEAMPNKELKSAQNKLEKIFMLESNMEELAKTKDNIVLSESCKTYLMQTYVLSKYGRVMEVKAKQMIKGTLTEEECIVLFSTAEGVVYNKNNYRIKNDYISGTPDLFDGATLFDSQEIIDIKSCWDIFTFLKNVQEPENDMYYWQLQGYMALTGAKIGTIAYCLVNTPDSIIEGEKYNLLRKMDVATEIDPEYLKELSVLIANRKFDDIPAQERLLTYSIDRNDEEIELMYRKIDKCREFLYEFEDMHLRFSKSYRKKLVVIQ